MSKDMQKMRNNRLSGNGIRKKNTKSEKFRYAIALILKSLKTRFLSTSNSATEWSEPKNFFTKIFTVKNCPRSEVFKLIGPFYRVLIFCSGSLIIPVYIPRFTRLTVFSATNSIKFFVLKVVKSLTR